MSISIVSSQTGSVGQMEPIEASMKLLEWIGKGNLKVAHPDFETLSNALKSQGRWALLSIDFKERDLSLQLFGVHVNTQKLAAKKSSLLEKGYITFDQMRKDALSVVRSAKTVKPAKRGSKAWYVKTIDELKAKVESLNEEGRFRDASIKEYMECAKRYALLAGKEREFDRLLATLLKKYGPRRLHG